MFYREWIQLVRQMMHSLYLLRYPNGSWLRYSKRATTTATDAHPAAAIAPPGIALLPPLFGQGPIQRELGPPCAAGEFAAILESARDSWSEAATSSAADAEAETKTDAPVAVGTHLISEVIVAVCAATVPFARMVVVCVANSGVTPLKLPPSGALAA